MEKSTPQTFMNEAALPESEIRKMDWAAVVVFIAVAATIVWTYLLIRGLIMIIQVALS